ncbi:isoleucine--tRNA ligase [Candidatus Dojkabacteria bacterium]|nr:isoleucine--tRNA ligase [Candidatus Dojkabacteria bacterium]
MFKIQNYKSVSEREDKTTIWWKREKMFERSIDARPENNRYSFLDGPPFVTGIPHYASLLPRMAKDVIPRFKTMQGYKVRHVWGWDCHGLPIEEKTEKKVGLKNRREIETYGINKFIEACRKYVEETSSEWGWYVDKIAEWVNLKDAYRTMDTDYMESVLWVFKTLYDKGLIYEGVKTLLYCTRCGTPVSKFEIAMDNSYADMEDPAVTVEFPITTSGNFKGAQILAWTTTPWTLPSNRALVIDPKETYVQFSGNVPGNTYIVAKKRLKKIMRKDKYKVIREFKGKELLGLEYEAPFDYFPPNKNDFKVYAYKGMVTMEEGTGVVHSAPGFGEIDTEMGKHYKLTTMFSVDDEGKFIDKVRDYKGMYVKDADKKIIGDLEKEDRLFKVEKIVHSYPYCWRCQTPLIQRAQKSWFINVQTLKPLLLRQAKKINWVPAKFAKRFENNIKDAPDWCISRTRYWATAMPVWKCDKCKEIEVFGSIKEIENRSRQKVKNLHRDGVDPIAFPCKKCTGIMKRIPEVLDSWMDAGSMPYGQIHYPFENEDLFKKTFPADYIIEYVAQIRAWFYVMHVLSNALLGANSFKNVVVTGVLWGTDGRKMSKSFGNYPDPKATLEKYGGDAMRLYFMSSPIMLGDDMNFNEQDLRNQVSTVIFPFYNSFKYFVTYANLHKFKPNSGLVAGLSNSKPKSFLDKWILVRLKKFHQEIAGYLEKYEMPPATRTVAPFINDLSTWYIRRSRNRFVEGDKDALQTLYYVLVQTAKITAPIIPFVSEEVYGRLIADLNLKAKESVHLCDYPEIKKLTVSEKNLLDEMQLARDLASLGQATRVDARIKVRQPLESLRVKGKRLKVWMVDILKEELNVKKVENARSLRKTKGWSVQESKGLKVALDTTITDELRQEGLVRELVRAIQDTRKKSGFKQEDRVEVSISTDSEEIREVIKKWNKDILQQTNSLKVALGQGQKEAKVNDHKVSISINK